MLCRRCNTYKPKEEFAKVSARYPERRDTTCKSCRRQLWKLREAEKWEAWTNRNNG